MCLSNSEEPIEAGGIILDRKPIGVRLCQSAFGGGFSGLGFDLKTSTPIGAIKTIRNPKSLKHRSCESQSLDLFIFFDIFDN